MKTLPALPLFPLTAIAMRVMRVMAMPMIILAATGLAFVSPASAQQTVRDYKLPPAPTPTASPNVQGPVDIEGVVPVAPRAIRTDTPNPSPRPSPSPSSTSSPSPTLTGTPVPASTPDATPSRSGTRPPAARIAPSPTSRATQAGPARQAAPTASQAQPQTSEPLPENAETIPASPPELPAPPEAMATAQPPSPALASATDDWPWWYWLAALLGLLAVLGLGRSHWRRRDVTTPLKPDEPAPDWDELADSQDEAEPVAKPNPLPTAPSARAAEPNLTVAPTAEPTAGTGTGAGTGETLHIAPGIAKQAPLLEMETVSLSRSVMALRLTYRLRIINRGGAPLEDLQLEGELAAAHGSSPIEMQRADRSRALAVRDRLTRLDPGETHIFKGEITLPVSEVRPIMQGKIPLLVPLLLWRCTGTGFDAVARTFLLGEVPEIVGNRLRPYRLDQPMLGFPNLGLKALD